MKQFFQNLYGRLIEAELPAEAKGLPLPDQVKRCFVNWGGFEPMYFIRKLVGDAHNILVIGDWWGRDYWSLRLLGKEVFALDIAPQKGIDRLVLADITQPLPFNDRTFDAVVMAEVLEHLVDDKLALENISQVLTPEGSLILTVPFLHDDPEVHVRVHTPRSIRRLLNACGFEIEKSIQRGGIVFDSRTMKLFFHLVNAVNYSVWNKTNYRKIFTLLSDVNWKIGQNSVTSQLLRFSKYWGAYLKCRKIGKTDVRRLNITEFSTIGLSN